MHSDNQPAKHNIIQRLRAPGLPVSPIAPPQPFTFALFCSWHWSSAMPENLLHVLCTTKIPDLNSAATSGCFSVRVVISRMCTSYHGCVRHITDVYVISRMCTSYHGCVRHITDVYRKPSRVVRMIQGMICVGDSTYSWKLPSRSDLMYGSKRSSSSQSEHWLVLALCTTPQKVDNCMAVSSL